MAQKNKSDLRNQEPTSKIPSPSFSQQDDKKETPPAGKGLPHSKITKKKILISILIGLILLRGGLGASAYWGLIPFPILQKKPKVVMVTLPLVGPSLKLPTLVINLKEENKRHFLKATIVLEIGKQEWLAEIKSKTHLLADLAI